ncbi:MAG: UDP-N-acetylmuramoyl-L-alanyl-D-glutamate--2,6-diaminopimelate ligase [Nitrospirota bacterium]
MTIQELLKGLKVTGKDGPLNTEIKGIAYDSRLIGRDFLFVAIKGFSVDGHDYIKDAVSRGAAAVIAERTVGVKDMVQDSIAYIEVPDSREALALTSTAFYGHPSEKLSLVGITGTNGKTTTSFITRSIIHAGGSNAGLLGSILYMTGESTTSASNTTPESLDLQRYLSDMVGNDMKYAVLEVSSHALSLKRVEGCQFDVAAYTNFSRDHLDFHHTMDEYFTAKCRIFDLMGPGGTAVLNWDDPGIRGVAEKLNCNVITCGTEEGAMFRAENIKEEGSQKSEVRNQKSDNRTAIPSGVSFDIRTPGSRFRVDSKFLGKFNVYNILMSAGIAHALGFSDEIIQQGIRDAEPVEGRFENIDEGQDFLCIVDFAHTDDALKKSLQEARAITQGKVITVFGCGGDRDRTKRPLMGAVASEMSDIVFVTSDNPRSEDPGEIIRDTVKGMKKNNYSEQPDREQAIMEALSVTGKGDTLIVAGKGHEHYQEIKGERYPFSDREILRREIKKRLAISRQEKAES